jgi:DNA-binding response OmpR family regulator
MPFVLIVEDDSDVSEMMDMFLRNQGFETECACNGMDALSRMRARRPCIVLLDIQMPVMDGFEFRRRQLADAQLATVPVVCITAHHDPSRVSDELGIPCLPKPVQLPQVAARVSALCR